jgi:hypothetical protein
MGVEVAKDDGAIALLLVGLGLAGERVHVRAKSCQFASGGPVDGANGQSEISTSNSSPDPFEVSSGRRASKVPPGKPKRKVEEEEYTTTRVSPSGEGIAALGYAGPSRRETVWFVLFHEASLLDREDVDAVLLCFAKYGQKAHRLIGVVLAPHGGGVVRRNAEPGSGPRALVRRL